MVVPTQHLVHCTGPVCFCDLPKQSGLRHPLRAVRSGLRTLNLVLFTWLSSSATVSTSLSSMQSTPICWRIWDSTKCPMRHLAMTGMDTEFTISWKGVTPNHRKIRKAAPHLSEAFRETSPLAAFSWTPVEPWWFCVCVLFFVFSDQNSALLIRPPSLIILGSDMRATPLLWRMSAGIRSRAITAQAPASSAILACSWKCSDKVRIYTSMSLRAVGDLKPGFSQDLASPNPALGSLVSPFSFGLVELGASPTFQILLLRNPNEHWSRWGETWYILIPLMIRTMELHHQKWPSLPTQTHTLPAFIWTPLLRLTLSLFITSMITPPFSIAGNPFFTRLVPSATVRGASAMLPGRWRSMDGFVIQNG